jgi:predicted secreted protein
MRKFVYGKDVVILAKKNGSPDYYPFACAESVKLKMETELVNTSTVDTGAWETSAPSGRNSWSAILSGVLVLKDEIDNLWFGWEMFLLQVRSEGLDLKFVMTDVEGNEKFATGAVWVPSSEISGDAEEFANYMVNLQGNGQLDMSGILDVIPEDMGDIRIEWIATEGQTVYQDNRLIGLINETGQNGRKDVSEVSWEGDDKFFVITEGEPSDRQVKLDNVNGTLRFKNAAAEGDYVWAKVKKI